MRSALYREFTTQEDLDQAYDAEASVPDFMAYAKTFVDGSARARSALNCELDVPYGPTLDETLDIFHADKSDGAAPVLIFLHGGYWKLLGSKDFSFTATGPVQRGATTVVVDYALCPKVTLDEIVRQTRASIAWTYRNCAQFGGDPDRIVVAGHSAGAQLTAMALRTPWSRDYGIPDDCIKGAVCISGLYDLRPLPYSFVQPALQLTWDQVMRNSPQFDIERSDIALTVSYGDQELPEFQRQSADFLQAWQFAGNIGESLIQAGQNHFSVLEGFEDPDSDLCNALCRKLSLQRRQRFSPRT